MIIIRLLAENCNNKFKKGLAVSKPLLIFAVLNIHIAYRRMTPAEHAERAFLCPASPATLIRVPSLAAA